MISDSEEKMVEIFAGTTWQAMMVKSLLENIEIEAYIKDEIMGTFNPWWTAPGGAGSVSVWVSDTDFLRAKEVVKAYEDNLKHSR